MKGNETTESLIERARSGDRGAFDQLVAQLRPQLITFARKRLGADLRARTEPEDVVQDALVRAFQSFRRFQWRGERSLFNWFASILEFRIRDLSRGEKRGSPRRLAVEPPASGVSASKAAQREERLQRLERALAELGDDHRKVIRLVRIEQLSFVEAARRMDRSPGAVRQLFLRALEKLRESFGGESGSLRLPARSLDVFEEGSDD